MKIGSQELPKLTKEGPTHESLLDDTTLGHCEAQRQTTGAADGHHWGRRSSPQLRGVSRNERPALLPCSLATASSDSGIGGRLFRLLPFPGCRMYEDRVCTRTGVRCETIRALTTDCEDDTSAMDEASVRCSTLHRVSWLVTPRLQRRTEQATVPLVRGQQGRSNDVPSWLRLRVWRAEHHV